MLNSNAAVSLSCFTRMRTERVAELVALLGWAGGAVVRVRLEWLWFLSSCLTRTRTVRVAELVALLLALTARIVVKRVLGRRRLYHPSRWVQVYDRLACAPRALPKLSHEFSPAHRSGANRELRCGE